jgi:formate dehydrogenase
MASHPDHMRYMPHILYRTLGPALPDGAAAAAIYWGMAQRFAQKNADAVRRAGFEGEGLALGNALFMGLINGRSGTVFAADDPAEGFARIGCKDQKIRLDVGEMLDELGGLAAMQDLVARDDAFPFILAAGERRSHTANCAIRDPRWMESNDATSLAIHPQDAARLGLADGAQVKIVTQVGEAMIDARHDPRQQQGTLAMPNGLGMSYPDARGAQIAVGVAPNELTPLENKDKFVGTPFHKFVPARLERIG